MYILEIFFKRRKFTEIFENSWKAIGNNISLVEGADDSADPQLELFYFVSIIYSTVYHAALAAGMSTSSAHYLARIQAKKSKIDPPIIAAAIEVFAAPDDEKLKEYATYLDGCLQPIVAEAAEQGSSTDEAEFRQPMSELRQYFQQCRFSPEDLFSAES